MEPAKASTDIAGKKVTVGVQQVGTSPLMETIQTVQAGKVPSNVQVEQTIESTKVDIDRRMQEVPVSEKGERLAKDAKQILEATQQFIEEKTPDELLQRTIEHGKEATKEVAMTAKEGTPQLRGPEYVEIQAKAYDVFYLGRRLSREVIYSKEFRRLLLEFGELISAIIGRRTERLKEEGEHVKEAMKTDFVEGTITETLGEVQKVVKREQETKPFEAPLTELTENEKTELAKRFRNILREMNKYPDYVIAVNAMFDLIDNLKVKAKELTETVQEEKEELKQRESIKLLWQDVREIIERFAGAKRLDNLVEESYLLFDAIRNDPAANEFWNEFTVFIRHALRNPESLDPDDAVKKSERLMDLARVTLNDRRYEMHVRRILLEARDILNCIQYDPATERISIALKKFAKDFICDWKGQPSIGALADSIQGFREVLLPVILDQLQHIPVAAIEGSSKKYDYKFDNIHFSAYDILPENLTLELYSKVDVKLREGVQTDKARADLALEMNHIKTHLKGVRFFYRRKEFPKMEDAGVADIDIGGTGTNIWMVWHLVAGKEVPLRFLIQDYGCKIGDMTITIKEAKHNVLDTMVTKMWNKRIKSMLEKEIEKNLRYLAYRIGDLFNDAIYNFNSSLPSFTSATANISLIH